MQVFDILALFLCPTTLPYGKALQTHALTEERDMSILVCVGRGAHVGDRQRDMGNPGLVRCRRCAMIEPPNTATEVPLCHSEAMTGSR